MSDAAVTGDVTSPSLYKHYRRPEVPMDREEVKKLNRPFTFWGKFILVMFFLVYLFIIWEFTARGGQWYLLGGLMFFYLVVKKGMALLYTPSKAELTKDYKVTAIVTSYNEKPESVVGILDALLALDYPLHEVVLVDDGSEDTLPFEVAQSFSRDHKGKGMPKFQIVRLKENQGKLEALKEGFRRARGDYVFLVDSDCQIMPDALTELLRPFEDGKTTSSVGNIGILNVNENFLTRLQSLKYFGAFQMGRAAQSMTGDVIICSGAFSLHKLDFILEQIDKVAPVTLFGVTVSSGDDRTITALSRLSGGKTRYQSTAYCKTEAPATWKKFLSQRRRWQRSAYIVSLVAVWKALFRKPIYAFWTIGEAYFWLITTVIFAFAIMRRGFYFDLRDIVIYFLAIAAAQAGFYLLYRPAKFLLVPLFSLVYGVFLTFVRLYTALTIFDDKWGTRAGQQASTEESSGKEPTLHCGKIDGLYNMS
ncbi:MAG: glycosyltransferase family 2 protein [Coriobacteriia bacterium]|nr:glycosyltransferase family 2 protein [Coriobacteriia bacterium]